MKIIVIIRSNSLVRVFIYFSTTCATVDVKTSNLVISCRDVEYNVHVWAKCMPPVQGDYFPSCNQWYHVVVLKWNCLYRSHSCFLTLSFKKRVENFWPRIVVVKHKVSEVLTLYRSRKGSEFLPLYRSSNSFGSDFLTLIVQEKGSNTVGSCICFFSSFSSSFVQYCSNLQQWDSPSLILLIELQLAKHS